jgi:hypothetical protein
MRNLLPLAVWKNEPAVEKAVWRGGAGEGNRTFVASLED